MRRFVAALAAALGFVLASAAQAVELDGFWYVLVHYQDTETSKPDQWRWEDRVWSFERKGDRLEWKEWPIVVLDDESGRFEPMRGGRASRVLGKWEPSATQLADIRDGVQVNSRGAKSKTLSSEAGGTSWSSGESAGSDSALVVTYSETWAIKGLPEAPIFSRDDSMGSGVTESMSGRTVYTTETVGPNGDEITGAFERDGARKGRFKLMRAGGTEAVKGAAKNQAELQQKAGLRAMASSEEIRRVVRESVQQDLAARGVTAEGAELEGLTDQAIAAAMRTGSADEAAAAIAARTTEMFYSFATRDAKHDDSVRYVLPFDPSVPRRLGQGVNGDMGYDLYGNAVSSPQSDPASHVGRNKYGFDWGMPVGTTVVAARDGEIARVVDGSTESGPARGLATNAVFIAHEDGTWGEYTGLEIDIPVQPGQKVKAGDPIAKSRGSGSWRGGLGIHFAVGRLDAEGKPETLPILFEDGGKGFVPVPGSYYGAAGGKATKADPPPGEATAPKP